MVGENGGLSQARRFFGLGQYASVLVALKDAGDEALDGPEYWFMRSEAERLTGAREEAVATARAGLEYWPQHVGLLDSYGLALLELKDLAGAESTFRTVLALEPNNVPVLGHLAVTLARRGRFGDAKTAADAMMRMAPDSSAALRARAQVAYLAKDPGADGYIEELLAHDPESPSAHAIRGNAALKRRDGKTAASAFAQAAALNPSNQSVARAARQTRVLAHPLVAPSRKLHLLGRGRMRLAWFAVGIPLLALHQTTLFWFVAAFWMVFVYLTPAALRSFYRRKYGEL
jgi:tetratricopeptide (TPR) repeat protein